MTTEEKRVQLSFTLKKEINEAYDKYCTENMVNKSRMLEHLMEDFLKKKGGLNNV